MGAPDLETARTAVGIIGNIISFFLFVSPVQTFLKIYKAKSVQEFSPTPYLATVLNCAMWMFYGMPFVKPDSTLVVTINSAGLVIELTYVAIFFAYANWQKRRRVIIILLIEIIFFGVVVTVTMLTRHTTKDRSMVVGIICIVFNIGMYAAPLTIMGDVIRTKSVKFLPPFLSLANFLNGGVWMAYALLKFDLNILIPNGIGAVFGAIQLILYATFYKTTNWDDDKEEEPPQLKTNTKATEPESSNVESTNTK